MGGRLEPYRFQNLVGAMYSRGNLEFSPDGFTLISPVGNRISMYGLKEKTAKTLPIEATTSFTTMSLSPNGFLLVTGNESGEVHIISLRSETILHVARPGGYIKQVKFSPCGTLFSVAKEDTVLIYSSPTKEPKLNPIRLVRAISDVKNVVDVAWSHDGRIVAVSSGRGIIHLYPVVKFRNFKPVTLTANTEGVVKTFFRDNKTYDILAVDINGVLRMWKTQEIASFQIEEGIFNKYNTNPEPIAWIRYELTEKHYYNDLFPKGEKRPPLTVAAFSSAVGMLVSVFGETVFLHEIQDFNLIQSMKIPAVGISTVSLNRTADWIAFGSASVGQLVVWEWQSESMILNQTAHYDIIESFDFSNTSRVIATGGVDGKIKVWNTTSALNFAVFGDHTGPITGLAFTQKGKAIVSSSRDGTVRAFDLTRYRNFRTFVTPRLVQLNCVSVDQAGELIISGGEDTFEVYLWSMQTGKLLDVFTGHTGPITGLQFSPLNCSSSFASCSLDKSLRIWPPVGSDARVEEIDLNSEATTLTISPLGTLIAVVSLSGVISLFDMEGKSQGSIDGYLHIPDKTILTEGTAHNLKNKLREKGFKAVAFSPDGRFLLAGGDNKVVCMFETESQRLVTSYAISRNRSLDGINAFIHRKKMTEFGNIDLIEDRDEFGDKLSLPGVRKGDMASRRYQNEIRVTALKFSPNGKSWAAATTEGLLIYGTQNFVMFDPIDADITVTPKGVEDAVKAKKFNTALMMSLQLNIHDLVRKVVEATPLIAVEMLVRDLPLKYVRLLLRFLTERLSSEPQLGLYLKWVEYTLVHHVWLLHNNEDSKPIFKDLSQKMNEVKNRTLSLLTYNLGVMSLIIPDELRVKQEPKDEKEEVMDVDINFPFSNTSNIRQGRIDSSSDEDTSD